jgi:hypothetical protein
LARNWAPKKSNDVVAALRQASVVFLMVTARFPANGHIIVRDILMRGIAA